MLCLDDSYCKECEAIVTGVKDGKFIALDKNLFYPRGGGQPTDTGKIIRGNDEFKVVFVGKFDGKVSHEVDKEGLKEGDKVKCIIDWERRYKLMRTHTAAHVLASTMHKELGALITGNELGEDKTRFDFNLENFDREKFDQVVDKVNELLKQDVDLKVYSLPRDEAMKIEGVVKLANALPPSIQILRIVEIPGIDLQADGGTHVKNLKEVGQIELIKLDNKGKSNRRIYFKLNT
ncbi:MAG TPA: alanyl-tRNA editing protein AlaXM [Candidatus Bilamarchaeaceae archaeon]|nr:alanyl-tRNA editing protein AlaXM [Candidatus Bilamarchaeaceae archaeon]